ncbi:MAG: metapyrocatechase [Alcaligenaceae bacterium]|nr:MAG: metapyrocatechase [Alcaligenaceae bacterium]
MTNPQSPNRPAIHSVDEFVFSVPDLMVARHFYTSFGLDVRDDGGALALYTHGHPHRWARVRQGQGGPKRLEWLSLGIHERDVAPFAALLRERGIPTVVAPDGADPSGLWLLGPDALPIQLRVAAKVSPDAPGPRGVPPAPANFGRAPSRSRALATRPLYLSHILLFTADVRDALDFYTGVLGLQVSDQSADIIAFLHTPYGSDHHLLAFAKSHGGGLHHSSWCVPSLDAVGMGSQQMATAGYPDGWGLGRHVLGSNYFRYVRDPWGSFAEYSFDIDYIEAQAHWPAADHPPEDSLYVWGPDVPQDFIVNHEVQRS